LEDQSVEQLKEKLHLSDAQLMLSKDKMLMLALIAAASFFCPIGQKN
jgi:hypothetical protein